jgi:hypothetical protein
MNALALHSALGVPLAQMEIPQQRLGYATAIGFASTALGRKIQVEIGQLHLELAPTQLGKFQQLWFKQYQQANYINCFFKLRTEASGFCIISLKTK